MAQAHGEEGLGVAYEANAAAASAQIDGSSSAEKGFDASYIWGQITDKLQILANTCGMGYDTDTTLGEKAGQMVFAHRRTLQDRDMVVAFAVASIVVMLFAGFRMRRTTETSSKLVSLILSGMWASQGVLMFRESCPGSGIQPGKPFEQSGKIQWPIEGLAASGYFGVQSLLFTVLGNSGFLHFYRPFGHLGKSTAHQMGLFLTLLTVGWVAGNLATKGAFCKLAYPLDLFTIAFLLATAEDSGYSKIALLLPILGMMARCTCAAARLNEMEEAPMALVSLICFYFRDRWGRRRDAYMWPEHRWKAQQHGADYGDIKTGGAGQPRVKAVKREPMLREVRQGEDGGVQGLSFVKDMEMVDEDGDEAMEFFDVTNSGLRKRTPGN